MHQTLNKNYSTTRRVVPDAASIAGIQISSTVNKILPYCGGGLRAQGYSKYAEDANKPLISIITVVYNGAKHIEKTISSILEQTYDNVEYIIIDGGSTDGTLDIIGKYNHSIDYWISESDKGIYDAMNKGLLEASGDYVWFINAGDCLSGNNLIADLVEDYGLKYDYIFGSTQLIDESEKYGKIVSTPQHLTKFMMLKGMYVCHQSILVRRKIANQYDTKYRLIADQKWIVDLLSVAHSGINANRVLSIYMLGGISDSNAINCIKEKMSYVWDEISWKIKHVILIAHAFDYLKALFKKFIKNNIHRSTDA